MANTKQAAKRARQAEKHRMSNKWQVSRMNTHIKRVSTAVEQKNKAEAQDLYKEAASTIDRMVNKGLVHKNKAARLKSRLNKRLVAIA
ncbi:MAG: 30S ribosomal protein S20 [Candidatus Berkiella sp.]